VLFDLCTPIYPLSLYVTISIEYKYLVSKQIMFLLVHPFLIYMLVHILPELTHWQQCIETKDISLALTVYIYIYINK